VGRAQQGSLILVKQAFDRRISLNLPKFLYLRRKTITIMIKLFLSFLALALCAMTSPVSAQDLLSEQLAQAKQESKLVFLDFTAKWCAKCVQMEKEVFTNPEIVLLLQQKYVFVKVDYDTKSGRELYRSQGLNGQGLPIYLILDPERNVKARRDGAMTVTQTQQMLNQAYESQDEAVEIKDEKTKRLIYGAKLGYNYSRFFLNRIGNSSFASAFHAGVVADYTLKRKTTVKMALLLDNRRGRLLDNDVLEINYLKVPVQFNLPIANNTLFKTTCPQPIWLNLGAYASYAIGGRSNVGTGWAPLDFGLMPRYDYGLRAGFSIALGNFEPSIGYELGLPRLGPGNSGPNTGNIYFSIEMLFGR
jgi:thiol-disulfide isomerase/thioredoxin